MGLFNNLFKKRTKQVEDSKQLVIELGGKGGITPVYCIGADGIFESEAAASCIQTNAYYCSKVEFQSVLIKQDGERQRDYPQLDKLLQLSPNPLQTGEVFWERTAHFYFRYNNAFIYVERDPFGKIVALWSLDPGVVEFKKIASGEILFKFQIDGQWLEAPYSEIIHIARKVTTSVIFGNTLANNPIRRVIDLINLNYKGIENAILTSAFIRFIGEVSTKLSEDELEKRAEAFTNSYLKIKDGKPIGVAFSDSSFKLTPIQQNAQKTATYAEANAWNQAVYKFFGCPEKVIAGTATEDEMVAYYERTPEEFFSRAAQEMTRKIFSDREYDVGNRIVYSDRKMQYLSMKTRLQIFTAAREIGAFTLGTLGDLLGLPVPKGKRDVVVTSQNYNDSLQEGDKGNGKDGKNKGSKNPQEDNKTEGGDEDAGNDE